MKKLIFSIALFVSTSAQASQILCTNSFSGEVFDMMVSQDLRCLIDVVYGSDNVCFTGDVEVVARFLADGELDSTSRGLKVTDVEIGQGDIINYIGWDQRNFYNTRSSLKNCQ